MSPDLKTEHDVIMYRAYIAQRKYGVVLDEISSGSPSELQAVKMFADYLANDSKRYNIYCQVVFVQFIVSNILLQNITDFDAA